MCYIRIQKNNKKQVSEIEKKNSICTFKTIKLPMLINFSIPSAELEYTKLAPEF